MQRIAHGKKLYLEYHRALFSVLYCLIFFCVIYCGSCAKLTEFASYADDITPYALGDCTDDVIKSLEDDFINLFKWFLYNRLKANSDKCHLSTSK